MGIQPAGHRTSDTARSRDPAPTAAGLGRTAAAPERSEARGFGRSPEAMRAYDGAAATRNRTAAREERPPADRDVQTSDARDRARNTGRGSIRPGSGGADVPGANAKGATFSDSPASYPTPPTPPASGDGSGAFNSRDAGFGDHFTEATFYRVADGADAMGLDNAARHMRHYLGGSGETLMIDPAAMADAVPRAGQIMDAAYDSDLRQAVVDRVTAEFDGTPMQFSVTTDWRSDAYLSKSQSQDWFYGVGGFSYAHTANVTVTPGADGSAQISIDPQRHVFDRYNWDEGKSVTIMGITVTDEQLGELHEVGLAQEFEMRGSTDLPDETITLPAETFE